MTRSHVGWRLQSSDVFGVALLGFAFLMIDLHPMFYSDVWGHLKFGHWIVGYGRLPDREPFTPFADRGRPYVNFQWISQVLFYLVDHAGEWAAGGDEIRRTEGGVEFLRAFHAGVEVLRFLLLMLAFRLRCGSGWLACVGLSLCLLFTSQGHLAVLRPQILGEVFFAALLLALSKPPISRHEAIAIPLVMVVWANTHGSFTIGLFLLGLCLTGAAVEACRKVSSWSVRIAWSDDRVRRLFGILGISTVAIAVMNPHGPFLYWQAVKLARHPNIATLTEWGPLKFSLRAGWHWNYLITLAMVVGTRVLSQSRFSATDTLLLVGFGIPPLLQQRMMVWWMMIAPWALMPCWGAALARYRRTEPDVAAAPSWRKTVLAAQLLIVTALLSAPMRWVINGRPESLDNSAYNATPWRVVAELKAPLEARGKWLPELATALRDNYPKGRFQGTVFSSELVGEYLLWGLAPDTPVLAYSHAHLFSPAYWLHFRMAKFALPGWRRFFDSHGVNLVVIEAELYPELRQELLHDPDWRVVLDETGSRAKPNRRGHLLVALRKSPIHWQVTKPEVVKRRR